LTKLISIAAMCHLLHDHGKGAFIIKGWEALRQTKTSVSLQME